MQFPKYVRFNNPHVLVAAAFYMQSAHQFEIDTNITVNLGSPYLLEAKETVIGIYVTETPKNVTYQSSNWDDFKEAPLAENMKDFMNINHRERHPDRQLRGGV